MWWAESNGPAVTTNISMNCHHIYLSELGVSEAVTRQEFLGKWCFSVLPLNLRLKAEKVAVNPPGAVQSEGHLQRAEGWGTVQSNPFCDTAPRLICSADTSFITKKRNGSKKMPWGRACMCWLHITQWDAKGRSGLPEVSPESPLCPTAFLRSLLCPYIPA